MALAPTWGSSIIRELHAIELSQGSFPTVVNIICIHIRRVMEKALCHMK